MRFFLLDAPRACNVALLKCLGSDGLEKKAKGCCYWLEMNKTATSLRDCTMLLQKHSIKYPGRATSKP